jgi:quinol monooxygenase YgiN
MERLVIAAYRPKPGKAAALRLLMNSHVNRLLAQGLVSSRQPILMESEDGTFVEVFGWKSKEAIAAAHQNPAVLAMWNEFAEVCDYVPVALVPEAQQLFSQFTPVDVLSQAAEPK